ncbi:MAG: CHAT domain-containing tetratricopeptide repeat protein [Ferruginibacter sp.]
MQKKAYQFLTGIISLVVFIIISAQSTNEIKNDDQQLPAEFVHQQDSLRKADSLAAWLYNYRAYVYEDPVKRISILKNAQSNAWRVCKTNAEREEWFNCLAAQGYYLLYGGNILRSIDAYEQAYRFYFDKPIPSFDVLEHVLKPLGNNYTRLGDYDRAFFIQEKSLALAEANDSSQIASICHNLATTAIWKDDLNLAKQYCEKGLIQVEKNTSLHGLLLSTLSEIFLKSGNKDSAEINSKAAIKILTARLSNKDKINVPYWLRGAWQGLGDVQKQKNESVAALASYQKATALIDYYYGGQRKREKAQLAISAGRMLQQLKQPQKAIEQYNMALALMIPSFKTGNMEELPVSKDLYGENTLLDALHGKADCLYAIDKKEAALDCYMLLYAIDKKLRHEFFSNSAKQQQQKENRQWAESAIETAFDLWKTSGNKKYADNILLIAEMSKAQLLLDEMIISLRYNRTKTNDTLLNKEQQMQQAIAFYDREAAMNTTNGKTDSNAIVAKKELQFELSLIQKQVKEKYLLQENLMSDEALPSVESLLQNIKPNTTVIEFFTGEKNIYCIEASKTKVIQIKKIEHADSVLNTVKFFVDSYFQSGPAKMINNPQQYYRDAFAVYKMLWPGIDLANKENCIVIPDGILGYLPFDALITDSVYKPVTDQWPFLVKKANLYLSYSLQIRLQQQKIKHPSKSFTGFFISFDSSSQSSLPAVKKEYDEIHAIMQGDYFNDKEASLSAFNRQLGEVNLLHISTHSFLQGKENMPVLQLADDRFFLFELYGKTFHPQLVVLSACRTGHGMLAKGEGIISLARGFTATGAAGIVAGLWDMNDETTASLMGSFYKLLRSGQSPASALQHAKLQWLQNKNAQQFQKLPYFWAGMVYSGDNDAVEINIKKSISIWWLIAVVAALAGLIFIIKKKRLTLS